MSRRLLRRNRFMLVPGLVLLVVTSCGGTSSSPSSSSQLDSALHQLLPSDIQKSGQLVIATDAEYPPCEYYPAGSATMIGFEPDLWNAMAAKMGVQAAPISISFDGLIPGVVGGRFPVVMECITDTVKREQSATFVDFMYDQDGIVTLASSTKGISADPLSLCGLTAGQQTGTIPADYVANLLSAHCTKNGKAAITSMTFPQESQTLLALESGRVDFTVDDIIAGSYLSQESKTPVKVFSDPLLPRIYLGILTLPNATGLQQAILGSLKDIINDGQYQKIMQKWQVQDLALTSPGINLQSSNPLPVPTP